MQQILDEEELVPETCKCPVCGERRIDWLPWVSDEWVCCSVCAAIYTPLDRQDEQAGPFSRN